MDPIAPVIAALHAEGRPRVWSLVITHFGDAVDPQGGYIAATDLTALMARVGIGAGALRTAVSRLAADGWILRDRDGRARRYRLSPGGREEVRAAAARIYAPPAEAARWTLAFGAVADKRAIPIAPDLWLLALPEGADAPHLPGALAVTGPPGAVPRAVAERLCTPAHRTALDRLSADLGVLEAVRADTLDPLTAMAARMLLIHRWRRLVLRHPDLPGPCLPAAHRHPSPRTRVAAAYRALLPASARWPGTAGGNAAAAAARFRG